MALSSFLNINGYDVPCPAVGFEYTVSTLVNSGRNVNGAVIGQVIGRPLYKFNNLRWVGLSPEERRKILQAIEPFYVQVTFEDVLSGGNKTITMYPSDRQIKPLFVDKETHEVTQDEVLSFNLIDCGLE
jgi:hypothetical protein